MRKPDFGRALLAGFVAWVVFTIVLYMAPLMGLPAMNVPAMLGGMFGMNSIALGWIMHLMIGLILALVYVYWLARFLPGQGWLRGLLFGLVPWIVMMVMVAPMLPMLNPSMAKMPPGFFFANLGAGAIMGSLVAHLIFGAVLGAIYGGVTVETSTHSARA